MLAAQLFIDIGGVEVQGIYKSYGRHTHMAIYCHTTVQPYAELSQVPWVC